MVTIIHGTVSDENAKTVEIINGAYPQILIAACEVIFNSYASPLPTGDNVKEHPVIVIAKNNGNILKRKEVTISVGSINNEVNL